MCAHVLRVIEMSDCMQFTTTIYTVRDNNPGVHSLLTRVHKSEVHIVSKLYGATVTIMFRHEVSMKSALLHYTPSSLCGCVISAGLGCHNDQEVGGFFEDAEPHMVFAEVEGLIGG